MDFALRFGRMADVERFSGIMRRRSLSETGVENLEGRVRLTLDVR